MHDARQRLLPLLLTLAPGAALLPACSEPEVVVTYEPGTPKEAVVEFNNALGRLDKATARSWVAEGDVQTEFFEVTYGMSEMLAGFKQRFIEVYGEENIPLLQKPPGAQLDYMDTHADAERLNGMIIDTQGDEAFAIFTDGVRMRVLRQNGQWRVDAVGTADHSKEVLDQIRAALGPQMMLASILDQAKVHIGEENLSPEEFDLRLGRFIVNAFTNLNQQAEASLGGEVGNGAPTPPSVPPAPTTGSDSQ